jgi:hypothetical protein
MTTAVLAEFDFIPAFLPLPVMSSFVDRHRRHRPGMRRLEDISKREHLEIPHIAADDVAVFPGQLINNEKLQREAGKSSLIKLINLFFLEGLSWQFFDPVKISTDTLDAARAFFESLPDSVPLPTIIPDGEDGLTVHWAMSGHHVLLVIDGWKLHLVQKAGTQHAEYFDDLDFDGQMVPTIIIEATREY